jgi:hypothetical protein
MLLTLFHISKPAWPVSRQSLEKRHPCSRGRLFLIVMPVFPHPIPENE